MPTGANGPDTVVLINGLWLAAHSWEYWADRYTRRGYRVLSPAWPGMEGEVEALNADTSPFTKLTIERIVDHYEQIVLELERPPIIVGHSFGGLFAQILLDRGLGAVGVGVASATVKGVYDIGLSTIKAVTPALNPFRTNPLKRDQAVALTAKQFRYAFTNTLHEAESDAIYRRYHVPAPTAVLREGAFANFHRHAATKVDFHRDARAPLLLIAFGKDHLVPAKAIRHNEEKYAEANSVTEFKEFPGRPHFPGAPGWEEVADYAIDWAEKHARVPVADQHGGGTAETRPTGSAR